MLGQDLGSGLWLLWLKSSGKVSEFCRNLGSSRDVLHGRRDLIYKVPG